jgi:hypothetical protein
MKKQVPKILHAIWLDCQPLPDRLRGYRKSWKKHLGDYALHEWTRYNLPLENRFVARQMKRGISVSPPTTSVGSGCTKWEGFISTAMGRFSSRWIRY